MTHNRQRVTKDQCGKVAHAGDVAKPFLAGLLPRGLATSTDDEQSELGLAKRDQCHWAHRVWNPNGPQTPRDSVLQENKKTKGSWVGKGTRDMHRAQTQPHWVEPTRQVSTVKDRQNYNCPQFYARETISGRFLRFCHHPGSHLFCQMDPSLLFLSFWSTPLLNSAYRLNPG